VTPTGYASFSPRIRTASRKAGRLLDEIRAISDAPEVAYVRQKVAAGLGDAILKARHLVGDEPFGVLLPDDLVDAPTPCLKQMIEVFERYRTSVVAIERVERKAVSRYGVIKGRLVRDGTLSGRLYRIEDMVEKPPPEQAPSNLPIIGRYILTPAVFGELVAITPGAGGEIQLTDALRRLLSKEPIYGLMFNGKRYDAGDKLGFLMATAEMALKRADLGESFWRYLKSLKYPLKMRTP
jgi:UTP--glucose-1-phosphate uridylyltransferase